MAIKLAELTQRIGGTLHGPGETNIEGVNSLSDAGPGEVTFLAEARYAPQAAQTHAAAIIVPRNFNGKLAAARIEVDDVDEALEKALGLFAPAVDVPLGIHPSAVIAPTARLADHVTVEAGAIIQNDVTIGAGTVIGPGCVLRRGVSVGAYCRLDAHVVIDRACVIGDRVTIEPNCTIGACGFGYRVVDGAHRRVPHVGKVIIEDDVEIGANCCIDRAKFAATVIARGAKIDNLVQIAHNVSVGRHCLLVSQVGIAGSSRLGEYVVLGGQVGIADHVNIGNGAQVGAQGGVMADIPPGERMIGSPARPARRALREMACVQKLPELMAELQGKNKPRPHRQGNEGE